MNRLFSILIFLTSISICSQTHFTTRWKIPAGSGTEEIKFYATTSTAGLADPIIYKRNNGITVNLIQDFTNTTPTTPKLVTLYIVKTLNEETTVDVQIPNIITFKLNGSEATSQSQTPALDPNVTPDKFLDVIYWGTSPWRNLKYAFSHVGVSTITATDSPNLSLISISAPGSNTLSRMFYESKIVTVNNINNWNVTPIRSFLGMFEFARYFNSNISGWVINSSETVGMKYMFRYAQNFNKSLYNWNVSNVIEADLFLQFAPKYNHPLPSFSNPSFKNFSGVLYSTQDFNQELNNVSFKKITDVSQALTSTFSRSPYKNTLLLNQIIKDKEVDGLPLSSGYNISVDKFIYYDYQNIYNVPGGTVASALGNSYNTFQLNQKYTVGTIYPIITTTSFDPGDIIKSNIGVLKEKVISSTNILRGEEFIADELYLETPIVGANAATTEVTFKMDANKDVTLYSKSYFSSSKNVKPIVNSNQYNVGTKTVVYKKGTTTPQDVSKDGTIVYDFTDNHLYVSKGGIWRRADN